MEKNIEDSIKDGLIITITTTGIFYVLKEANVKPPEASLSKILQSTNNGSTSDATTKFYGPLKGNKITQHYGQRRKRPSSFAGP